MMNKLLILCLLCSPAFGQRPVASARTNDFFVLHNAIRGDSVYDTFDEQVALIKGLGYDGVEINQLDSFDGMKAALDKHNFTGSYFYFKLNLDAPTPDPRLEPAIRQLKGSRTILSPYVVSDSKRYISPSGEADSLLVRHLRQLADWAEAAGLSVALYPHLGFYVERTDHALRLVHQTNRPSLGLTFNLCHWLATTRKAERSDWQKQLRDLKPHLKMMTICGANDVEASPRQPGGVWTDYILPLGTGSFDTYGLVRYVVQELGFRGPIGVQCYSLKVDKPANLRQTMAVWQRYTSQLDKRF